MASKQLLAPEALTLIVYMRGEFSVNKRLLSAFALWSANSTEASSLLDG